MQVEDVEARLIEAVRAWEWGRADGQSPWAKDAPWDKMRLGFAERYNAIDDERAAAARVAWAAANPRPDNAMIDRVTEAAGWLQMIGDDSDRRLVIAAVRCLAHGWARVPWTRLLGPMGLAMGAGGLAWRYAKAMKGLAKAISLGVVSRV